MTDARSKKKILLAEDDGDDRQFFVDFLGNRTDIELLPSFSTGVELLHYLTSISLEDEFPDIIILDQNMPKMTGKETLVQIRSIEGCAKTVVIIYSTYVGQDLINECLQLGASLVKAKPVSMKGYNDMMDEILTVCKSISVE